jgi:hypothetical protein
MGSFESLDARSLFVHIIIKSSKTGSVSIVQCTLGVGAGGGRW